MSNVTVMSLFGNISNMEFVFEIRFELVLLISIENISVKLTLVEIQKGPTATH